MQHDKSAYRWAVLVLIFLNIFLAIVGGVCMPPLFPEIVRDIYMTKAQMGLLMGLYTVALFATFLVGVQSGDGEKRNYLAHIVLVLILSVVFLLIVDLDRSQEGLLQVNQQAMFDLQRQLNTSP